MGYSITRASETDMPGPNLLGIAERINELRFEGGEDQLWLDCREGNSLHLFTHVTRMCLGRRKESSPFEWPTYSRSSLRCFEWFLQAILEADMDGQPIRWKLLRNLDLYQLELSKEEIDLVRQIVETRGAFVEQLGETHEHSVVPFRLTMKECTYRLSRDRSEEVIDIPAFDSYAPNQVDLLFKDSRRYSL